jgi:hypothetical protein
MCGNVGRSASGKRLSSSSRLLVTGTITTEDDGLVHPATTP